MASNTKSKSLGRKLADLVNDSAPKGMFVNFLCELVLTLIDFDPEDDGGREAVGSSDESGSEDDDDLGREHYEEVGYVFSKI